MCFLSVGIVTTFAVERNKSVKIWNIPMAKILLFSTRYLICTFQYLRQNDTYYTFQYNIWNGIVFLTTVHLLLLYSTMIYDQYFSLRSYYRFTTEHLARKSINMTIVYPRCYLLIAIITNLYISAVRYTQSHNS